MSLAVWLDWTIPFYANKEKSENSPVICVWVKWVARTTPDQFFTLGLFVDEGIYATVLLKFYCEKNDKCFFPPPSTLL